MQNQNHTENIENKTILQVIPRNPDIFFTS